MSVLTQNNASNLSPGALLLFDEAMRIRAMRKDLLNAAREINLLSDRQLSVLGINRSDVEDTIERYV